MCCFSSKMCYCEEDAESFESSVYGTLTTVKRKLFGWDCHVNDKIWFLNFSLMFAHLYTCKCGHCDPWTMALHLHVFMSVYHKSRQPTWIMLYRTSLESSAQCSVEFLCSSECCMCGCFISVALPPVCISCWPLTDCFQHLNAGLLFPEVVSKAEKEKQSGIFPLCW